MSLWNPGWDDVWPKLIDQSGLSVWLKGWAYVGNLPKPNQSPLSCLDGAGRKKESLFLWLQHSGTNKPPRSYLIATWIEPAWQMKTGKQSQGMKKYSTNSITATPRASLCWRSLCFRNPSYISPPVLLMHYASLNWVSVFCTEKILNSIVQAFKE